MEEKYLTMREVAVAVGVPYQTIYHATYRGAIPNPPLVVGGRTRLYTPADVERVRAYFDNKSNKNKEMVK